MSPKKLNRLNPRDDEFIEMPTGLGTIVCRLPGIDDWDAYIQKLRVGKVELARREVVQVCSENDLEQLKAIFAAYPAVAETIVDAMSTAIGDVGEIEYGDDTLSTEVGGVKLTFNRPTQADYEAQEALHRDTSEKGGPNMRSYVINCFAGDEKQLMDLFLRYPGAMGPIFLGLGRLAGKAMKATVKKGKRSSGAPSKTDTSPPTAS